MSGIFNVGVWHVRIVSGITVLLGFVMLFRLLVRGESVHSMHTHFPILGKDPSPAAEHAMAVQVALISMLRLAMVIFPYNKALLQTNLCASVIQTLVITYMAYTEIFPEYGARRLGMLAIFYGNLTVQFFFWRAREDGRIGESGAAAVLEDSDRKGK